MYDLMLPKIIEQKITSSMTEIFSVKAEEIDISDADNFADRNWDALIFCEYSTLQGDLVFGLSVYASKEVGPTLSEKDFSLRLARKLGVIVVFSGNTMFPSVWRAASPEGNVVYIRLEHPSHEGGDLRIIGTQLPLPGFPHVPLDEFPDLIRIEQIPTPAVDSFYVENQTGELRKFYQLAVCWERLTKRMGTGWPPFGWYPLHLYQEDLEVREEAGKIADLLPEKESEKAHSLLTQLDQKFYEETVETKQGKTALEAEDKSPWYKRRVPRVTPWQGPKSGG